MKTFSEWVFLVLAVLLGVSLIFFGVGGLIEGAINLTKGIFISLVGFIVIVAIVFYCNRGNRKKFPPTFSENLKILRKRGF